MVVKTRTEGSNIRSFQSQLVVKSYKPVKYIPNSEKITGRKIYPTTYQKTRLYLNESLEPVLKPLINLNLSNHKIVF